MPSAAPVARRSAPLLAESVQVSTRFGAHPVRRTLPVPAGPGHSATRAEAEFAALLRRLRVFVGALPVELRAEAERDVADRLNRVDASLRKTEKALRRRALGVGFDARAAEVRALAPDLVVDRADGGWALVVRKVTSVPADIAGERTRIGLAAEIHGAALESRFLDRDVGRFVRVAHRLLDRRIATERAALDTVTEDITRFVEEREHTPFYDETALRVLVRDQLRLAGGNGAAELFERIRRGARRLDWQAEEKERVRTAVRTHGLLIYKDCFPLARSIERRITFYAGPTNSGKTWHALNRLVEAGSGAYLAPLRLLALEGQEELEKRGAVASFLTGEERDLKDDAPFLASTIEMLDTNRRYDAVVIDEVQLLTDDGRGWAWAQALIGAAADEVILTGSPDALPLVEAIAEYLGEPLEVHRLERHTPLHPLDRAASLKRLEPGTAVVAFSRREVLALKAQIEATGRRVAVVYGNLTPEVRRSEARRFRSGEAEVLVASDAIALGLNLPIRTLLLSTLEKWDGKSERQLTAAELLQVGGRAGRFGHHDAGFVGALHPADAARVREVFAEGFVPEPRPMKTQVRPGTDHIEAIAAGLETQRLAAVLASFRRSVTFDVPLFEPGVTDDMETLAEIVDRHPAIPLRDRLGLSCAPIDVRTVALLASFEEWTEAVARNWTVTLPPLAGMFRGGRANSDEQLRAAETEAKRLTAYAWLAYRNPETFPDLDECQSQRVALDAFIERSLAGRAPRVAEEGVAPGRDRGRDRGRGRGRGRGR
jgi:hypothetical protein